MIRVKICGITNWADAELAVDAGASLIGLNFWKESPRYIPPAHAIEIVRRLPRRVQAVGVFVDEPAEIVSSIAQQLNLNAVQLHGGESTETVINVAASFPVIKAFTVASDFKPAILADFRAAAMFLLDGSSKGKRGGTGKTFDWQIARRAARYGPILLAGGITPENVAEAIRVAQPFGIDVCSGVEVKPGQKDPARVRALIEIVRMIERSM